MQDKGNISLSENIGNQVRQVRTKKNLTQTELAERLGSYQPSIAKLESGENMPSLSYLQRVADSLGKRLDIKFI